MCWCDSFAGVGVKNIDTLGYEPPKSSERSRPQEMAELMGLGERFGGAARRHTVSIPYRAAIAGGLGGRLAAFTVLASADDQQCHLDAKIAAYPVRRIRELKERLPFPCYLPAHRFAFPASGNNPPCSASRERTRK